MPVGRHKRTLERKPGQTIDTTAFIFTTYENHMGNSSCALCLGRDDDDLEEELISTQARLENTMRCLDTCEQKYENAITEKRRQMDINIEMRTENRALRMAMQKNRRKMKIFDNESDQQNLFLDTLLNSECSSPILEDVFERGYVHTLLGYIGEFLEKSV